MFIKYLMTFLLAFPSPRFLNLTTLQVDYVEDIMLLRSLPCGLNEPPWYITWDCDYLHIVGCPAVHQHAARKELQNL